MAKIQIPKSKIQINPKSQIPNHQKTCLERVEKEFTVSLSDMRGMMRDFHREMERGLRGGKSSLRMIPTYVDTPTGREQGKFIALDLGGTNFRIIEIALRGGSTGKPMIMKFVIDRRHMTGRGEELFDFIASCMAKFLKKFRAGKEEEFALGFTFSFPVEQEAIDCGRLACWTKGFTAKGVVGEDVVRLLTEAFHRQGIYNVRISALLNDTVGTLVARAYGDRSCDVGVILGTGTNACYREKTGNIKKNGSILSSGAHMIINIEWGNFKKLRLNSYDRALDKGTENRNSQLLEKTVSGKYLGELVRLVVVDLVRSKKIFSGAGASLFCKRWALRTEDVSLILSDDSPSLRFIQGFLNKSGVRGSSLRDRKILKDVCLAVAKRAGRISAAALAAVLTKIDPRLLRRHTVAIDGSVYEKLPGFSGTMRAALVELFGKRAGRIRIALSKDGSGKGAAIVAAVAQAAGA